MKKLLKWFGFLAITVLTSGYVKNELRNLWEQYDDFDLWYKKFINFIDSL